MSIKSSSIKGICIKGIKIVFGVLLNSATNMYLNSMTATKSGCSEDCILSYQTDLGVVICIFVTSRLDYLNVFVVRNETADCQKEFLVQSKADGLHCHTIHWEQLTLSLYSVEFWIKLQGFGLYLKAYSGIGPGYLRNLLQVFQWKMEQSVSRVRLLNTGGFRNGHRLQWELSVLTTFRSQVGT